MLVHFNGSTSELTATVTTATGGAVSGATVTVTVTDRDGTALVSSASMTEGSGGAYTYTMAYGLLPTADRNYTAVVTAISGASRRSATAVIRSMKDMD